MHNEKGAIGCDRRADSNVVITAFGSRLHLIEWA